MVKTSVFQEVKDLLENSNVCRRCVLRFLGEKEYTCYASKHTIEKALAKVLTPSIKDEAELENLDVEYEQPSKKLLPSPCAACLGILQDSCEEVISKINHVVTENKYVFRDFVLQLSLPVVVDLREKLFFLYLKEKFGEAFTLNEDQIPSVKDVCKWVIGPQYGKLKNAEFTPNSSFQILCSAMYPDTVKECLVLYQHCPKAFPNAVRQKAKLEDVYTKTAVLAAMQSLTSEIEKIYTLPPLPPSKSCSITSVQCSRSPLYLGGRYNKYSRELSQTPWVVDGERRMDSSVNELITDVVEKKILADKIVFSASGREDVDVKMLGNGRPFVLELLNPRSLDWTIDDMRSIEDEINGSTDLIAVKDLQVITKEDTALLKAGEEEKKKSYSALCVVKKTLTPDDVFMLEKLENLTLKQKTPIRVLHRRTLSTREKMLHCIKAKILDDHHLEIKIETQAGTYVKEFVHGDFGRTTPNLGTLLETEADILELDVECIHLDWPPKQPVT